ncbi:glycosyltransferase [Candidatus Omnitrophota bacterium]
MKVILISRWVFNPYQKLLVKHLRSLGIQIEEHSEEIIFLPKIARTFKPDILHIQLTGGIYLYGGSAVKRYWHLYKICSGLFFAKRKGNKIICTVHDITKIKKTSNRLYQLSDSFICKMCDKVIVHSNAEKVQLIRLLKLRERNVSVVPHGNYIGYYKNTIVPQEARKILNIPDSSFAILFFGWMFPHKGLLELIDAVTDLRNDRIMLIIAGKSGIPSYLEQVKKKIGHRDAMRLTSEFIPDDQIQVYMSACDVVAIPYLRFTTSGVALLAMSFGKACIAPRLGSLGELLDDKGAFLYDPTSKQGLPQAITTAIQNEKTLPGMGQYNKCRVQENSWDRVAEMTVELYKQSISGNQ